MCSYINIHTTKMFDKGIDLKPVKEKHSAFEQCYEARKMQYCPGLIWYKQAIYLSVTALTREFTIF